MEEVKRGGKEAGGVEGESGKEEGGGGGGGGTGGGWRGVTEAQRATRSQSTHCRPDTPIHPPIHLSIRPSVRPSSRARAATSLPPLSSELSQVPEEEEEEEEEEHRRSLHCPQTRVSVVWRERQSERPSERERE